VKNKDLSITEVSAHLGVTRRAIYNYFESETITQKVSQRFIDHFKIDIRKYLHLASIEQIKPELNHAESTSRTIHQLEKEIVQLKCIL